ncbi:L-histidine N(alpha)-methyltransferase [Fodinicola feengrottensis]|uniref:Histidine N-alpha-methyltransferase n=1 Tax=Fodinicola feengrottensis TaxID=435914 RepID=A0ABP4TCB3_9ACTN|nr:L-histidine N(alpha)-methyltransferase [Fodinicola feengrottensis]
MSDRFTLDSHLPEDYLATALAADVRAGLGATPKTLPPKWFYDERGSELFDQITELPEYYPTRTERELLRTHSGDVAVACPADTLVELGSGSSEKTRLLLDALDKAGTLRRYVPVDVSPGALIPASEALLADYRELEVHGLIADFEKHLDHLPDADRRIIAFLGGTIGNLTPAQRADFLSGIRAGMGPADSFLLGTGLVIDPAILVPAYDDAAGVTAEFNKNVLHVINRDLSADFDIDSFEHVAVWDSVNEWIEMRLRSRTDQQVRIADLDLSLTIAAGEEIRTEISAKFQRAGIEAELAAAGFTVTHWWTDPDQRFALSLSEPA